MNIQTITHTNFDGTTTDYVIISNEDGSFSSMPKADYDALQAASTLPSNSSTPQAGA
jgi:hypothetical protein